MTKTHQPTFEDRRQNFWHLSTIQSASTGLPVLLFIGGPLAKTYGTGTAILSALIGNLIIWVIGLALISMTMKAKEHAIENIRKSLGRAPSIFASIVVVIGFLFWFTYQIQTSSSFISTILENQFHPIHNPSLRIGATLGVLTTLLSTGGIRVARYACSYAFPFLLGFTIFLTIKAYPSISIANTWGISLNAILITMASVLVGIIMLPTFFRHSRSHADSFLGLSLMTLQILTLQILGILIGATESTPLTTIIGISNLPMSIFLIIYAAIFLICSNLVNIYFASVAWETVIPRLTGAKEYAVVGLAGTATYTFVQTSSPMLFLENLANNALSSLGAVLILSFLVQLVVRHRPRRLEKFMSSVCWLVGIITAVVYQVRDPSNPSAALLAGIAACVFTFLVVIFVEESLWSGQNLSNPRKSS